MSQEQHIFENNEAWYFPRGHEAVVTQKYAVNKYALHVSGPFVLYPIVAPLGGLITFANGRMNRANQTKDCSPLPIPEKTEARVG